MRTLLVAGLLLAAALSVTPTASADPCEPTPHGFGCGADLLLCTAYSGAESNGVGYSGFDCGAVSCDFMFYQGRLKDSDCSGPTSTGDPREHVPETRPLPVDCVFTGINTGCSVQVGGCQFRQTHYHLEERQETEVHCLSVECTWSTGGSSVRAQSPFCPVLL